MAAESHHFLSLTAGRALLCITALPLCAGVTSHAQAPPSVSAQRAVLIDPANDRVMFRKADKERTQAGSIGKLMTAYVTFWAEQKGYVHWNDMVALSKRDTQQGCTCMNSVFNIFNYVTDTNVVCNPNLPLPPGAKSCIGKNTGQACTANVPLSPTQRCQPVGPSQAKPGERFFLKDLLKVSLNQSTGESTDTIAEHVAAGFLKIARNPTSEDPTTSDALMNVFLGLMNQQSKALGLYSRWYTVHGGATCDFANGCNPDCQSMDCYTGDCPNGAVCQSGGTLALDVAKLWRALAKHTSFLTMIGDRGPWTLYEQTTPPKAYGNGLFPWGHNYSYYPGLDGDKNGFSTLPNDPAHDCNNDPPNGPPNGAPCWVAQATRAGRRLIATALQAGGFTAGTNDLAGMFRYGFSYALMPVRLVDSGKQMTEAVNQHKLACSEGMCFSAYTTADGQLKLVLWGIDLDKLASVTVAPGPDQAGGVTDFDVAYHNFSIVLGSIVGGNVKLSSWQLGSAAVNPLLKNVQVKFMGDSGSLAGTGNTIRLLSLEDDVLVSIVADAIGIIRLTTWKVGSNGTFTRLQDTGLTTTQAKEYAVQGGIVPAWALAGPLPKNYQVVVATVTPTNTLRLNSWLVQPSNGSILFQNSATTSPETIRNVSIATDGGGKFATYLTKGTSPSGTHEITFWDVNADGTFSLVQQSNQGGDLAQETGIAPLGPKGFLPGKGISPSAFLTGLQQGGELKLIAWDLPKFLNEGNAADYRVADSGMVGGPVSQLRMAEMANPTPGDERYVTALKQEDGTLKLIGWSLGKTIGWTIEEPTPVNPTCTAYENQLADLESELQSNGDLMPSADPGLRHWLAHENLQLVQKIKKLKAKVSSCPP